jgi:hypothetical protein
MSGRKKCVHRPFDGLRTGKLQASPSSYAKIKGYARSPYGSKPLGDVPQEARTGGFFVFELRAGGRHRDELVQLLLTNNSFEKPEGIVFPRVKLYNGKRGLNRSSNIRI